MKTYTSASNAKRALKTVLSRIDLRLNDVAFEITGADKAFVIDVDFAECEVPDGIEALREIATVTVPEPEEGLDGGDNNFGAGDATEDDIDLGSVDVNGNPTEDDGETEDEAPKPKGPVIRRRNSTHGGVCAQVWAICDSNDGAPRKDILEACFAAGIADNTAKTQYQRWKQADPSMRLAKQAAAEESDEDEEGADDQ